MNIGSWKMRSMVLTLLFLLVTGCGGVTGCIGRLFPTNPEQELIVDTAIAAPETETVTMFLRAQKASTQHSSRPEPFVEPASVDEIVAPGEDSWRTLEPGEATEFQTYDGVRIAEEGEALLDLGDLMRLILRRDSVVQIVPTDLAREKLATIQVDFDNTPLLQQIVLAMHLSRGGFLGEKSTGSGPFALTTPNAVVIVSGTTFFVAYDPDDDVTWVGNFGGTMNVADVEEIEGGALPDKQLVAIPDVRGIESWPIQDEMTPEEFLRLVDQVESPIAAANMISSPYLVGQFGPGIEVRTGPGTMFYVLGSLAKDEYAKVIGKGLGWWQIECPRSVSGWGGACWVSGEAGSINVFNDDIETVPETAVTSSLPTPLPPTLSPPTATPITPPPPPPTLPPPTATRINPPPPPPPPSPTLPSPTVIRITPTASPTTTPVDPATLTPTYTPIASPTPPPVDPATLTPTDVPIASPTPSPAYQSTLPPTSPPTLPPPPPLTPTPAPVDPVP